MPSIHQAAVVVPTGSDAGTLRRLALLRGVSIGGMVATIVALSLWVPLEVRWSALAAAVGYIAAANTWMLRARPRPAATPESQLLVALFADVAVLGGLLHFHGGAQNPFLDLLVLPVAFAAATLRLPGAACVAAWVALTHALLYVHFVPLPAYGGADAARFHLVTEVTAHSLVALLIAYFVVQLASALRRHERLLAEAREKALRDAHILAIGTLAAGAAHELGTPLSTMAVVVKELQASARAKGPLAQSLGILASQIGACKTTLSTLLATAGSGRGEGGGRDTIPGLVDTLVARFRQMRADTALAVTADGPRPGPDILVDASLTQTLLGLLNNAADASPGAVELAVHWSPDRLDAEVRDRGPGIAEADVPLLGQPFFSTKSGRGGRGLGLFLARATVSRLGGTLTLERREGGGTVARLYLPLAGLRLDGPST